MTEHSLPAAIVSFGIAGAKVRVVKIGGDAWLVAADVCQMLDLGNSSQAVAMLDDDEKNVVTNDTQDMDVINESGLYSLLLVSEVKWFRKWVTADVLPTIRKQSLCGLLGMDLSH